MQHNQQLGKLTIINPFIIDSDMLIL